MRETKREGDRRERRRKRMKIKGQASKGKCKGRRTRAGRKGKKEGERADGGLESRRTKRGRDRSPTPTPPKEWDDWQGRAKHGMGCDPVSVTSAFVPSRQLLESKHFGSTYAWHLKGLG